MSKKLIIVLIMCFYSVISLFADNTYFVSATAGSDSDGYGTSADTPYKTLEYAWDKAVSASGNSVINIMTDLDMENNVVNNSGKRFTIQSYDDGSNKKYTVYPKKADEPVKAIFGLGRTGYGDNRANNASKLELKNLILDGSKMSNPSSCLWIISNHNDGADSGISLDGITIQNFKGIGGILNHQSTGIMCSISSTCKVTNNTFTTTGYNIGGGSIFSISGEISNNTLSGGESALIRIGGAVATGPAISNLTVKNNVIASTASAVRISSPSNETRKIIWSGDIYIFDNKDADGNQRNFFLGNSHRLNIDSSSSFGSKSKIGLTSENAPNATTDIDVTSSNTKDYSSVFVSDNPNYFVANIENALKLIVHKHQWSYFAKENKIFAYCSNPVGSVKCNHNGIDNSVSIVTSHNYDRKMDESILPKNATSKHLVYFSSNKDVAVVNEKGLVTALSTGTAEIVAKSADGSDVVSNVIKVTVTENK